MYYYLVFIQNKIYRLQNGAGQPHVYSRDLRKFKLPILPIEKQNVVAEFLDKSFATKRIDPQDTSKHYSDLNIFGLLLNNEFEKFNCLLIAQLFQIDITNLDDIPNVKDDLLKLEGLVHKILSKMTTDVGPL